MMSKYSIPAGTISAVEVSANSLVGTAPVVNMWWAHALIDSAVNASSARTNAR